MQSKAKMHREIVDRMNKLYVVKNEDYGDSFGKSIKKFGITAALVQIEHKWQRICNLIMNGKRSVKDETIADTLIDMANYCIMTLIEMQYQEANANYGIGNDVFYNAEAQAEAAERTRAELKMALEGGASCDQ